MSDDTYLMLVDGKVTAVDLGPMLRRHRAGLVETRAAALEEAAELLMNESFDLDATWDAGLDAGLSELDLDSAGNVALTLAKIERHARPWE